MSNERKSWFIREVSLGNLIIALPMIGGLFVAYGKWTSLQVKTEENTATIGMLVTNLESFISRYNIDQIDQARVLATLSAKIDDDRAVKGVH